MKHKKSLALLRLANRVLKKFVKLKLVPCSHPTRDFDEFFNHVKALGFKPDVVIDVGVAFGTKELYDNFRSVHTILIEPNPDCQGYLEKIRTSLKSCEVHHIAASDEATYVTFNKHDDISGSSILEQVEGKFLDGVQVQVKTARLDSLELENYSNVLLKIDTQGYELKVLDGCAKIVNKLSMVIVESSMFAFRTGGAEIGAIFEWMVRHGFACYDILEGHYRMMDNALAQVDIVFIRKNSDLRISNAFFAENQVSDYIKKTKVLN